MSTAPKETKQGDAGRASPSRTRRRRGLPRPVKALARAAFYIHLWIGVLATVLFLTLAVTGILLNHKKALGFQPGPENAAPAPLEASLPLAALADRARAAHPDGPAAPIDRMDVRPDDGLVKVRFEDDATTEISLALDDGRVLTSAPREDVFLEKLHSGEIFGDGWILLSDGAAAGLLFLTMTGLWIWLFPRWRQ